MDFNKYQQKAVSTDFYKDDRDCVLGFASEAGEVAGKVSKIYRDGLLFGAEERHNIALELGDCLWYIAAIAARYGISLEHIARMNIEKLKSRKERGVLGGYGDDR